MYALVFSQKMVKILQQRSSSLSNFHSRNAYSPIFARGFLSSPLIVPDLLSQISTREMLTRQFLLEDFLSSPVILPDLLSQISTREMLTRQFLLEDFLSSPLILGGLLCTSGDTRFLNASEFSSVFEKRICDFLFQFATRSLIY